MVPSYVTAEQQLVADLIDRVLLWSRRGAPVQISTTSITTMDTLAYAGPLRITDLAERERVSQPGMTTLVNRLVAQGYVERVPDPSDGRATLVCITADGQRVLQQRHAVRSQALSELIAQLDPEHQAALVAAADALEALTNMSTGARRPAAQTAKEIADERMRTS